MFCSSQWTMLSIARCNADRRRLACPGRRLLGQSWPQDYASTHLQSLPRRATLIMHTPSPVIDCDLLLCIVHRRPHAMASGSRSRTVSQTVPSAQYHIGQELSPSKLLYTGYFSASAAYVDLDYTTSCVASAEWHSLPFVVRTRAATSTDKMPFAWTSSIRSCTQAPSADLLRLHWRSLRSLLLRSGHIDAQVNLNERTWQVYPNVVLAIDSVPLRTTIATIAAMLYSHCGMP